MAPGEENIVETKLLNPGPPRIYAVVLEATIIELPAHRRRRRDAASAAPILA